jgi:hypothetical protein
MDVIGWLVAAGLVALVAALAYGLITGRLNRRAEGCCTADASRDLRMRTAFDDSGADSIRD